ncbi:hypothetical protein GEMRC1_009422 [Eukaryota sp. GEM-RC1]
MTISNCTQTFCSIYISPSYTLGNHLLVYESYFNSEVFVSYLSYTLVQTVRQELFVSLLDSSPSPCEENNFDEFTCTVFEFSVVFNIYFDTSFYSANVSLSSITIFSDYTLLQTSSSNSFAIISPPLTEIQLLFSYESSTVFLSLVALDCQFPKVFSNGRCICDLGFQLSRASGSCLLCTLNSFSDMSAPQVCRNCPYPRVTLIKGASSLNDCVCPKNSLDIDGQSCFDCPSFVDCDFGQVNSYSDGFLFSTPFDHSQCYFKYLCRNNSCIDGHSGDQCLDCSPDYIFAGGQCIKTGFSWQSILIVVLCVSICISFNFYYVRLDLDNFLRIKKIDKKEFFLHESIKRKLLKKPKLNILLVFPTSLLFHPHSLSGFLSLLATSFFSFVHLDVFYQTLLWLLFLKLSNVALYFLFILITSSNYSQLLRKIIFPGLIDVFVFLLVLPNVVYHLIRNSFTISFVVCIVMFVGLFIFLAHTRSYFFMWFFGSCVLFFCEVFVPFKIFLIFSTMLLLFVALMSKKFDRYFCIVLSGYCLIQLTANL